MSYVARSSALWFNLPGCVAAYQPVRAPGPLMARYNQARGGSNRYKAIGTESGFSAALGWFFAVDSGYLDTGVIATAFNWSMIVRIYRYTTHQYVCACGAADASGGDRFSIWPKGNTTIASYIYGGQLDIAGGLAVTGGIMGIAGNKAYRNGIAETGTITQTEQPTTSIKLGKEGRFLTQYGLDGYIAAWAVYSRTLSPAEVWSVSRQMQYCDVNPDWSAWCRRRKWYYLAAGGFQAAWADYSNSQIGTGVQ